MTYLREIQPIIPVKNVDKTVKFFNETLGFKTETKKDHYARVKRDNVGISFVKVGDNIGQLSCYIWVENIEELHRELESKLLRLPKGRYRPLFDQKYGMKEFHVIDLDSLLIFFGEKIT